MKIVKKLKYPINTINVTTKQGSGLSICVDRLKQESEETFPSYHALLEHAYDTLTINHTVAKDAKKLAIEVSNSMNRVAGCTHRGPANHVLVSQNTQFNIEDLTVIIDENLADDEMLICYDDSKEIKFFGFTIRQILDSAFIAQVCDNGSVKAVVKNSSPNYLGQSTDFGVILKIA